MNTKVTVGQVWQDNDRRIKPRFLKIEWIKDRFAFCEVTFPGKAGARRTRVHVSRFKPTSTGYRLVRESDEP